MTNKEKIDFIVEYFKQENFIAVGHEPSAGRILEFALDKLYNNVVKHKQKKEETNEKS